MLKYKNLVHLEVQLLNEPTMSILGIKNPCSKYFFPDKSFLHLKNLRKFSEKNLIRTLF